MFIYTNGVYSTTSTLKRRREEERVQKVEESLALGMHLYGRTYKTRKM